MIAVIQRVNSAEVIADGILSGKIGKGLYILLGIEKGDDSSDAIALADKISKLRIFSDENGKMNLSVTSIEGEALSVSNFTLCANYAHGNRPDYFNAELPEAAKKLYLLFNDEITKRVGKCEAGIFGADMQTTMTTDGPVTIFMDSYVLLRKERKTDDLKNQRRY
jgi:D-tyrosyl-tRNA(Tyr) deacylase